MSIDLVAEPLNTKVVRRIREKMAGQRMSQVRLAGLLGRSTAWVAWRLQERTPLGLSDVEEIARALYVPIDELLVFDATRRRRRAS